MNSVKSLLDENQELEELVQKGVDEDTIAKIEAFAKKLASAGEHVSDPGVRDEFRSILHRWRRLVYQVKGEPLDVVLQSPKKPIKVSFLTRLQGRFSAFAGYLVIVAALSTATVAIILAVRFLPVAILVFQSGIGRLRPAPTLTPTAVLSTPAPTPVASTGTLVVAQFEIEGSLEISPTQLILKKLDEELEKAGIENVRLESVPDTATSSEEARALGESYEATLVIYGEAKDIAITSNLEVIKEPWRPQGFRSREIASEPKSFSSNIGIEKGGLVPEEMAYFSTFTIGQIYYQSGQYGEASASFQIALSKMPEEGGENVFLYAGLADFNLQEYQSAIEVYSKTLELDPKFAEAFNNRGLAYAALGDCNKAIEDYTEAISITAKFAVAYNNRGLAYTKKVELAEKPEERLSLLDQAIADYTKAIGIKPDLAVVFINRGLAYADKAKLEEAGDEKWKDLDLAVDDFGQALSLDSYYADAYFFRGNVYYDKANLAYLAKQKEALLNSAIEDYTMVIRLNPNNTEAYYKRGIIRREIGKKLEAINDLETFLELAPGDPRTEQVNGFIKEWIESLPSVGQIAFASDRDGNRGIYVMEGYGFSQTRLTKDEASSETPAWSPDGERIAFASNRDGDFEIYVMNNDGTGLTRLTGNEADDRFPAWSPDGGRIAFESNRDGDFEIYVMNRDGSDQRNLTHRPASDKDPTWSPDSSQIAFTSDRDGDHEIYVMGLGGGNPNQITDNSDFDGYPSWSPDSDQIAFVSNRDGNYEVYVMNSDGSKPIRLTNNEAEEWDPAWSPDGSQIAFVSDRDGDFEIYAMNSDGTGQTRLTNNETWDRYPAWSALSMRWLTGQ